MCVPWTPACLKREHISMQRRKWSLNEKIFTRVSTYFFKKECWQTVYCCTVFSSFLSLSSLLSQGSATRGCLLHHLWLQSAQNSLVERISEMKCKYLPRECHRWRERDRKEGARDQEGCENCFFEAFFPLKGASFSKEFWRVETTERKSWWKDFRSRVE